MHTLFPRFPGNRAKALTLSYDDGVEQDIRLLGLMEQFGIKGTFNLNSERYSPEGTVFPAGQIHRIMTKSQWLQYYNSPCAEVALHGATHPFLDKLPKAQAFYEVVSDRANLEAMFGRIVRGMAYPYGTTSDDVVDALAKAGVAYSRTTVSNRDFRLPENWLRLGATCHHNDPQLLPLAERFLTETPKGDPYLFYLWGHSYEFEMNDNWDVIEAFFAKVAGKDEVWYATNIEVYDYLAAFARLRLTLDGAIAENPTATDLWALANGKSVFVPAGATVETHIEKP